MADKIMSLMDNIRTHSDHTTNYAQLKAWIEFKRKGNSQYPYSCHERY